jgi:hypothetical protein
VALIEPHDPASNARIRSAREFHARVVMVNRESMLIEETPEAFAEANKFRMLPADQVATIPMVHFRVETFHPADGFRPSKPYAARLLWRDLDGNDQSKLLLTEPQAVLNIAVRGGSETIAAMASPRRGRDTKRNRSSRRGKVPQP